MEKNQLNNPFCDILSLIGAIPKWGEKAKNEETAPQRQQKVGRKSKKCRNRPAAPAKSGSEKQEMKKPYR
jgi:hypothetical protein